MENEEYPSDSDQSDEDFCPENNDSDVSEEESGADEESDQETKIHQNKKTKNINKNSKPNLTERSTRTTIASQENIDTQKDHLDSDEDDDKKRTDALWADFLSDTKSTAKNTIKNVPKETSTAESKFPEISEKTDKNTKTQTPCQETRKVTEILEFAGEEIKVTKEIPIDNNKAKNIDIGKGGTCSRALPKFNKGPMKRPSSGGGLGAVLGQLGKKTKISVLEKSKLDWDGFKQNEGLTEELQTFNKGKDGYLERQDFLQRTDVRQFEIEKNLRQNKRNN